MMSFLSKDGTRHRRGRNTKASRTFGVSPARTTPMSRRRTRRARLYRTAKGQASLLCHVSHALMESREGVIEDHQTMQAFYVAEREAAVAMVERLPGARRVTVGAD